MVLSILWNILLRKNVQVKVKKFSGVYNIFSLKLIKTCISKISYILKYHKSCVIKFFFEIILLEEIKKIKKSSHCLTLSLGVNDRDLGTFSQAYKYSWTRREVRSTVPIGVFPIP